MKTLTIVSPVYEEAAGIERFYQVLHAQLQLLSDYSCSILFVVDRCKDESFSILARIAENDCTVSVMGLSSRFGNQISILAGIDHAYSDVVITMDSDLQNPPSIIPLLLAEYEKGNDIVNTVRVRTEKIGILRRLAGALFYWLINIISDVPITTNASDFRLISRRVATILREQIRERNLFIRGIISWIGFNQSFVSFVADERIAGRSKFSPSRLIQFAIFGIVSFSKKPLRAASVVGICFAILGAIFGVVTVVQYFLGQTMVMPGYATIVVLLSMFGGLQLFFLGVIGEYIGAIFDEVKGRPHYIIQNSVGLSLTNT